MPACGKCNQSKGNSYWKDWILADVKLSPKNRNVENLVDIIIRLEKYESWSNPKRIDFEVIVGKETWEKHWENCERLHKVMQESQQLSDEIKQTIETWINKSDAGI
ncbi:hypothetical protein [Pallidibacillus pasinlerensis]|uniref:HNH endonuclease n=1 Tax=Pallidibacillus pasinlerensis TaxID=2703818 RepID=A0ABX0A5T5_9BACI|nr:hypothetical protein [Pallidibacillus pasinlerensis]NCU18807.1 hypothetical protein [Pallidibacillus pasinlerensis]